MLSSGGVQNTRPASAPGEDAPTAGPADRNEVNCALNKFYSIMSIQKLEELNVGMENLGEEVKSLTQQCNGNGNTPASEDNNNPPSVTPEQNRSRGGGVVSSTPQRSVGGSAGDKPQSLFVPVHTLEDTQAVRAVAFHPSGALYAVGSNSKTLRVCAYPEKLNSR
ncbi:hypothetical protein XENOCAPTIV_020529 [Xenoophorus captivus]|uniref:Uncharacterized protein n=1 Tax=Xenoophorus captivus TaxID=1517983 RepID=A0ABV0R1B6_9TELE